MGRLATTWERLQRYRHSRALGVLIVLVGVFFCLSLLIHMPQVEKFDLEVTEEIQEWHGPLLNGIFETISFLGNTVTLIIEALIAMAVLRWRRHPHAAWLTALTLIGLPLNLLLKEVVGRPRPSADLVDVLMPTIGLSFPSGHAMASTMFFGFLAFLSWTHLVNPRRRLALVTAFALLPILISISRVYVGAHWFSDVFGGITAGLFFLILLVLIYRKWVGEAEEIKSSRPPRAVTFS